MKIFTFILPLLMLTGFTSTSTVEIWQVDLRTSISATKSGGYTILKINVRADNDDTARSPKLIVSLPRNSRVTNISLDARFKNTPYIVKGNAGLGLSHKPEKTDGAVEFDIRNLNKEDFNVQITIVPASGNYQRNATASSFVHSITPELNKRNNYADCQVR